MIISSIMENFKPKYKTVRNDMVIPVILKDSLNDLESSLSISGRKPPIIPIMKKSTTCSTDRACCGAPFPETRNSPAKKPLTYAAIEKCVLKFANYLWTEHSTTISPSLL